MIEIAKEKIGNSRYEEVLIWRERKSKWSLTKEYIREHKFLTLTIVCLSSFIIFNMILIHNFFRLLGTL